MEFSDVVFSMWPLWLLGLFMVFVAWKSGNENLLRVEKNPVKKWCIFLTVLTAYRLVLFKLLCDHPMIQQASEAIQSIPWQMSLLVFWEDMAFALPVVFLGKLLGDRKWLKPIYWIGLTAMMLSFGSGHIYQGWIAACALSFYVPFSVSRGKLYGFGTVVLCHMLYDISTIIAFRLALGF